MKVDLSCPIELWAFELPTQEKPVCSFTFFNLGARIISSIQITVTCFDERDVVLSRRVERPMALDAKGRETFSVVLPLDGLAVDSVDLIIDKAWFEDGSEWRRAHEARLVDYQPNELPPNRKLEQLRYIAGDDAVGYPSDQGHVWICVCGRVNAVEETECRRCKRDQEEVFARYAPGAVQATIDRRERELEERARQAREEASRQEFLRQERARRKRINRRVRTVALCLALVAGAVSYLFIVLGLPELRYQSAKSALASGDFTLARETFANLSEYRDASTMLKECDLRAAQHYITTGEEAKVDEALLLLEALDTYPGALETVEEASYQKALLLMNRDENREASGILKSLSGYRDSDALYEQSEYALATQEMDRGEYESASKRFTSLGLYLDSAAQARKCVYLPAMQLMANGAYDEAAEMFGAIVGYSDAATRRHESIYQSALKAQASGDYEGAASRFMQLGGYEDADEQVKKSIYLAAVSARDEEKYDTAVSLFETFPDYEDAAEQAKECRYVPAKALMEESQFAEAAALLKQITGYKDAQELYNQCIYKPAIAAIKEEDYETAIELLAQIPGYNDSEKQLQQARYHQAERLEAAGEYEEASDMFRALGEYNDAKDRMNGALYKMGQAAFEEGHFSRAADIFEAIGDYKDAAERVMECTYELTLLSVAQGDMQAAYDALVSLGDYAPAQEKAKEVAYQLGVAQVAERDFQAAAEAFALAGDYEDADERRMDCVYEQALVIMEGGGYQEAAEMFDGIAEYSDARVKRDECYDLWLYMKSMMVTDTNKLGMYEEVIAMMEDIDLDALPRRYAELRTIYYDANYTLARQYINDGHPLKAYPYLLACNGYKSSAELLDKNIYRILGTWESEVGVIYAFYLDGTCSIAGQNLIFNMQGAYAILTGTSEDNLERTLSYSSGGDDGMTLREEATKKTVRLTRIKEAEESAEASRESDVPGSRPVVVETTGPAAEVGPETPTDDEGEGSGDGEDSEG